MSNPSSNWWNNEVQFARLLCEIVATEELLNWPETRDSMDLEDKELQELYDRARVVWEKAKEEAEYEAALKAVVGITMDTLAGKSPFGKGGEDDD